MGTSAEEEPEVAHTVLFVVLDGLADDPVPELGDRTPLAAAATPNMDALARGGAQGLVTVVGEGIAPESDVAVMALLGFDPAKDHPGRGPVEAIGAGLDLQEGELAWRCNFATVGDWPELTDRRVGRDLDAEEAQAFAEVVNAEVELPDATFEFRATVGHRGVLVIRSDSGSLRPVTNTDPAYRREGSIGHALESFEMRVDEAHPVDGEEDDDAARRAAELTNAFTRRAFEALDANDLNRQRREAGRLAANVILSRDAGTRLPSQLRPLGERFDARFGCFVEMPVEAGISRLVGMEEIPAAQRNGSAGEQYRAWAEKAAEVAGDFGVLYLHLKGPDIPAHDGDHEAKREIIEVIDDAFFGHLEPALEDAVLLVTADHATSCVRAAHTDDPVPYLVHGPVESDDTDAFSEEQAARGSLPHRTGMDLMPYVVDLRVLRR